ncbi:uncharacterized protein LOC122251633 [Penaeus japonicus]|uniref:uncharacterized protein LOC122251633 n=1 Tax=Penaeus japonicus TaxID=27405 RepID=UPI001C713589|nr:uncharacterized protein LOC122251633 [Penaeus japonicus]
MFITSSRCGSTSYVFQIGKPDVSQASAPGALGRASNSSAVRSSVEAGCSGSVRRVSAVQRVSAGVSAVRGVSTGVSAVRGVTWECPQSEECPQVCPQSGECPGSVRSPRSVRSPQGCPQVCPQVCPHPTKQTMRSRLKLQLFFALSLLAQCPAQECDSYRVRGFKIPLDSGQRKLSVFLERDMDLWISFGSFGEWLSSEEGQWHQFTAIKKGSEFCVEAPSLLNNKKCSNNNVLILRSSLTTWWKLDCRWHSEAPEVSPHCRQHQLHAVYLGLDSAPVSLYWKPTATTTYLSASAPSYTQRFKAEDLFSWNDIHFEADYGDRPCRIRSESLNIISPCNKKFNNSNYVTFKSINNDGSTSTSYFELDCPGIQQGHVPEGDTGTPPRDVPLSTNEKGGWTWPRLWILIGSVFLVVFFLLLVVLVVLMMKRKKKPPHTARQVAIPAENLPPRDSHDHPHDPGSKDDQEEGHVYCYIDLAVLKSQLEEEERTTRTQHDGDTTSLASHDSENSLYAENLGYGT